MMGSVISAPIVQKETLWIGVFRRHIMKKRGLKLDLKGWTGRERSCAFPSKWLVISTAVTHARKQQPWIEMKYLT